MTDEMRIGDIVSEDELRERGLLMIGFDDHENHERLDPECPECEVFFEEGRQAYREEKARLDVEEDARAWEQASEAARDRADWILMEDR